MAGTLSPRVHRRRATRLATGKLEPAQARDRIVVEGDPRVAGELVEMVAGAVRQWTAAPAIRARSHPRTRAYVPDLARPVKSALGEPGPGQVDEPRDGRASAALTSAWARSLSALGIQATIAVSNCRISWTISPPSSASVGLTGVCSPNRCVTSRRQSLRASI